MLIMDGSDQVAVLDLYEEAAYADLGTITPELLITRPRVVAMRRIPAPTVSPVSRGRASWFRATAPPRAA